MRPGEALACALLTCPGMLYESLQSCLNTLFPRRCAGCDWSGIEDLLCPPCAGSLIPGDEGACPQCGVQDIERESGMPRAICGACISAPPAFRRARGAYAYGGALATAIGRWKNLPDVSLTQGLCDLFGAVEWERWFEERPHKIIFVPPDSSRLRRRGFHPAGLLARELARQLQISIDSRAVRTCGTYRTSRGQGRGGRRDRLRGVFSVEPSRILGRRLVLVDDVMTTGATVDAISRACMKAGAASVEVVVLARAPR
jgi:ComF family protein